MTSFSLVVVGAGGVGSALVPKLARYCQFAKDLDVSMTVIDGDDYEAKNASRQDFNRLGNKAEVTVARVAGLFPKVKFTAVPEFLTSDNIEFYVGDGAIVFVCVDNNKSRLRIDAYLSTLKNGVIICGGNDMTDGNVQVVIRRNGKDVTESLRSVHREIKEPTDKSPDEMSCEERAMESAPQLFFANDLVSSLMCMVFYGIVETTGFLDNPPFGELYFDLQTGQVNPVSRTKKEVQP